MSSVCVLRVFLTGRLHNLHWLAVHSPGKHKGNVTTCASNVARSWNCTLINDSHCLSADVSLKNTSIFKHHYIFVIIWLHTWLFLDIDSGHSRRDGPSLFNSLKHPPVFVLWHVSPPLPVPGKLPACTPFHQEPQEMSLGERWSLIKNKWMGCPRDRVNEEWELEAELELVPQSGRRGREEPGNGKTKF